MATRFAGSKIANFLGDKPRYDQMGSQAVAEDAQGFANTVLNNAKMQDASMRAEAEMAAAEAQADSIRASAEAQGQASMVGSIAGAVGSLGSSLFSGGGGGGGSSYTPGGGGTFSRPGRDFGLFS